jgi:hypothetical protein
MYAKIVDEDGKELGPGEIGELLLKGVVIYSLISYSIRLDIIPIILQEPRSHRSVSHL